MSGAAKLVTPFIRDAKNMYQVYMIYKRSVNSIGRRNKQIRTEADGSNKVHIGKVRVAVFELQKRL